MRWETRGRRYEKCLERKTIDVLAVIIAELWGGGETEAWFVEPLGWVLEIEKEQERGWLCN